MIINIKATLACILLSLFITSCTSLPSLDSAFTSESKPVEVAEAPFVRSGIAICSGDLKPAVATHLETEYQKLTTKVDDTFTQYVYTVLEANGVTQEKSDALINCVLAVDERDIASMKRQQQKNICEASYNQCVVDAKQCMKKETGSCFDKCNGKLILSQSQCMDGCFLDSSNNFGDQESGFICEESEILCKEKLTRCMAI